MTRVRFALTRMHAQSHDKINKTTGTVQGTRPCTNKTKTTDEDNNRKVGLPCSIPYGKEMENVVWEGYVMNSI